MKKIRPKTHVTAAPGKNLIRPGLTLDPKFRNGRAPKPLDPPKRVSR